MSKEQVMINTVYAAINSYTQHITKEAEQTTLLAQAAFMNERNERIECVKQLHSAEARLSAAVAQLRETKQINESLKRSIISVVEGSRVLDTVRATLAFDLDEAKLKIAELDAIIAGRVTNGS